MTAERNTQQASIAATDAYGRHLDTCCACGAYSTVIERCPGGEKLLARMAAFWGKEPAGD